MENADWLTVHQIISKPYVILKMPDGTIHRGIHNRTKEDRFMFWIGYSKKKMFIEYEKPQR